MMDVGAIALRSALWWLLLPAIGLPVSLIMARRGERGFLDRLRVWFALIPLFLGAAYLGPWPFAVLLAGSGAVALAETARLEGAARGRVPARVLGTVLVVAGPVAVGPAAAALSGPLPRDLAVAIWLLAPVVYFTAPRRMGALRILAAALYLGAGLAAWSRLLAAPAGYRFVLVAFSVVTVADIIAFVTGRVPPRVHLFPRLSPRKTLFGFLGGGAAAVAVGFILRFATPELGGTQVLAGALVLAGGGVVGDLLASGIKRRHGVKDFGRALGRMGGVLDRLDSLLGAGWAYILYLAWATGR